MPMFERENYLRNARMQGPKWTPCRIVVSDASWREHGCELRRIVLRHPTLFPGHTVKEGQTFRSPHQQIQCLDELFSDSWGCTWKRSVAGLEGIVIAHPLADWQALAFYRPPDPLVQGDRGPANWAQVEQELRATRSRGEVVSGGPPHGFFFLRLGYLRGFENLMLDFATESPVLPHLVDLVAAHNRLLVEKWLSLDIDVLELADDLGSQRSSIVGPHVFHRWIRPHYEELARISHRTGALVALHSDGYIMDLMDELLGAGIDIINPQDLVNGIDDLAREVKGRACIRLDIDRQAIVPYGTRSDIRELIEEEVRKLGSAAGGLEFVAGIYPPTTPDQVDALAAALEEFCTYWWDGRGR